MSEYKDHIVKSFDDDIENIKQLTTQMATLVEEQFKLLYHVIDTASPATIEDILDNEPRLDQYDAEIRDAVITIITLRAPIAIDLRATLTALRISTDLERLGDYAKNIAMRVAALETIPDTNIKNDILRLVTLVQTQMKDVIDAYLSKDIKKAENVRNNDLMIDQIKDKVPKLKLLTYTKLLFAIKTLERAGDHICNIAEEIHFIVTGEDISTKQKPSQSIEKSLEGSNK
jgi:phosphate transport system protein